MGVRAVIWRTTAELIAEAPVLGYGLGGYPIVYEKRVKQQYTGWKATPTTDPHNQYLALLAEAGVPGLLAFFWFLLAAARQRPPLPWRALGVALLAAWCVTSLFSSHFQIFNEGHLIAIFVGAFLAEEAPRRVAQGNARRPATRQAASAASTAARTAS